MTRIRLTRSVVSTRSEAEQTLGEVAANTAELNALKAQLNQDITAARQKYEGRIEALERQIEQKSGLLQQWAEATPEEFADKKSIDFLHGRLGFRTGNPTLKTISGWTFKRVLEVVDRTFVRTKEELDKEGVLAAHTRGELDDKGLRSVGLRVVQDEAFFIEPKLEEAAGKIVTAAN
jgi:phage host-nuclease inhibitor protein Gam